MRFDSRMCLKLTLWSSPARELASQLDTNVLGSLQFPREIGHDVHSISTANSNSHHSEAYERC